MKYIAKKSLALVLVLCLIATLSLFVGCGSKDEEEEKEQTPEAAVEKYFDATVKYDTSKIGDLAPNAVWEYIEDEEDISLDDIKNGFDDQRSDLIDEVEDEYGKNYKVNYEISDKEELSDDDLEELAEAIDDNYDGAIKKSDVKKAYRLDIEGEIKGSEGSEEIEMDDFIVVSIKGKWYPVSAYGNFYASMFTYFGMDIDEY